MGEVRSINITSAIEGTIYALAIEAATENGETISSYVRNLIIWDLVQKKKLSQERMAMIMTGQAMKNVQAVVSGNNS